MTPKDKFQLLASIVVMLLLAGGLTYYLLKSWKSKAITLVSGRGIKTFLRDSDPLFYWFTMILYTATALFGIIKICFRICEILKHGKP
jgi:hypothetical protein